MGFSSQLPDFPWDSLATARKVATSHSDGLADLSVGTPVDNTPAIIQNALEEAANAPGYPTVAGTPELRRAIVDWFARRRGVSDLTEDQVLPTIGSKEAVAMLPSMLGLDTDDVVLHPEIAYPTYDVGARLAGATPVGIDPSDAASWPTDNVRLVWLNSPSNPTGQVMSAEQLRDAVAWVRERGAVLASDECYAELPWTQPWITEGVPSALDPRVTDGSADSILVAYSLSKQSSMAGYRAAFLAGDGQLLAPIRELRKHAGMMVPRPVQDAMVAALGDDDHVARQRELYRARRTQLVDATAAAGLHSHPETAAGLYLWLERPGLSGRQLVDALAKLGILVAPGDFYGPHSTNRVRMALTATDEAVGKAAQRLHNNTLARP